MTPTSLSLLERLKGPGVDPPDWDRFHSMYLPLIRRWIVRIPGLDGEVEDLVHEVILVLLREVPRFERQREGSFRAWLRQVTVNRVRSYRRDRYRRPVALGDQTEVFLDRMFDSSSDLAKMLDDEHDKHVCNVLKVGVRADFNHAKWDAFEQFAVEGRPAAEVARELGLTVNAVVKAKARVLARLREEAGGIQD
jgi:RNA polymerase sigma-70 factor (ECF subfamily)